MTEDLLIPLDLEAALGMDTKDLEPPTGPSIKVSLHTGARHFWKTVKDAEDLAADIRGWPFQEGDCYHCMSNAMVDSFTWLKLMLSLQPIQYIAISTYSLFTEAAGEVLQAWETGRVQRVDFYLGTNVQDRYPDTYRMIKRLLPGCGGRLVVFKNHSKLMAIEGEKYDILVESSANMNEVLIPHFEQTCVTVSRDLVRDTINALADIPPFNKNIGADPYRGRAAK